MGTAYATSSDLATFTGVAAPAAATRMLARASELIDDYLRTAVYATDDTGAPTDAAVIAAMRDATCAQVEMWMAGHEEDDVLGPLQSLAIGNVQAFAGEENRVTPMYLAPRAARILRNAGIMRAPVVM